MPYQDRDKQRAYQREWIAKRRKEWFDQNGPCETCGSEDDLQLDHLDPSQKIEHRVWTWAKERRERELAKCRALCVSCHREKSKTEFRILRGEEHGRSKLSTQAVMEIKTSTETSPVLAARYGVSDAHIRGIRLGKKWAWLN